MALRIVQLKRGPSVTNTLIAAAFKKACKLPWQGNTSAKIMIVVDPVILSELQSPEDITVPFNNRFMSAIAPFMKEAGIKGSDCVFVSACRPIDKDTWEREKLLSTVLKEDHATFMEAFHALKPRLVIAMGKAAARQISNRAVKITKIRGVAYREENLDKCLVMPTLGIGHVLRVPEHGEMLNADLREASRLVGNKFDIVRDESPRDYQWLTDLGPLLDWKRQNPGKQVVGVDTESSSFGKGFPHWYLPETKVLTVQISVRPGQAWVIPIDYPGYPITPRQRNAILFQLSQFFHDPNIFVVGHNIKHDYLQLWAKHKIKIKIEDDTILLVHALNENMLSKALEDVTRVHLPKMAGYKDAFTRKGYDMSRMDLVPPDDILAYSAADADVVGQLRQILLPKAKADQKNFNCYGRVVMPAIRAFCDIEQRGFMVNRGALEALRRKVAKHQEDEYKRLVKLIPNQIVNDYKDTGVGLKLGRAELLKALFFTHPAGLKLKPRQFTKSKEPSVSTKTHLPYFATAHPIVDPLIKYIKNEKMLTTYIGEDGHFENGVWIEPTGFWKYIHGDFIRPSYLLHRTVTGRSASQDPNGQNFPKRGDFAKEYRAIFQAPPGWYLIEADYSQLELRVAGILAQEPTFLQIYASGGDIHCMTAAVVMGISLEEFMALKVSDPDAFALGRYRAKAVNFGFIYGMGYKKFMVYAKTEYGIDYTEEEAKKIREAFFGKYTAIDAWHRVTKNFVKEHKYVRALDGRLRHLPAVVVDDDGVSSSAERQAINSPVQGFGSDLGLIALTALNARVDRRILQVVGFVHDAIICIAKKGHEIEAARQVKAFMQDMSPCKQWFNWTPPIPIVAEVSIGNNLAKMIEIKDAWLNDPAVTSYDQVKALDDAGKAPAKPPKLRIVRKPRRNVLRA